MTDRPSYGQGVWRLDTANGVVTLVDHRAKEVTVKWYNSGKEETIEMDHLVGCWDDSLKQWVISL